jgi:hypothetical protein
MSAMPRTFNRRPALLPALRRRAGHWRLVVLVFSLGVAAQSMLGALGELHEMTVHGQSGHDVAGHMAPHDHAAALQDGTDVSEGGPLHLLLHYTHCCGHSTWMAGAATMTAAPGVAHTESPVDNTRQLPAPERTAPFRPPIAV